MTSTIYDKYRDGEFEMYIDKLCNLQRNYDILTSRETTTKSDTQMVKQIYAKLCNTKRQIIKRVVALRTGIAY